MRNVGRGDHVPAPFNSFCGSCFFCRMGLYGNCDNWAPAA